MSPQPADESPRPRVSVVVPTYNRARYIVDALDSVFAQTFRDIEVIVVDDGSTDDTAERLAPYAGRIEYVRTANQGPARARNEGMGRARGEYIAWLDSDDLYYPFKLELQVEILDRCPDAGFVYSEFTAFDDAGWVDAWHLQRYHASAYRRGVTYDTLFEESEPIGQFVDVSASLDGFRPEWRARRVYRGHIFHAYLMATVVFTNSLLFRRELLDLVGLEVPRFGLFYDLEFVLRLCRQRRAVFVDVPTYKLRYHPDQVSTTSGPERGRIAIRKQQALRRVFEAHRDDDPEWARANRAAIDRQAARLCRAVAVPMLSLGGRPHEERSYPRRARRYLARAAALGHPDRYLWALSFAPPLVRRVAFAVGERRRWLASWATRGVGE